MCVCVCVCVCVRASICFCLLLFKGYFKLWLMDGGEWLVVVVIVGLMKVG